MIKSIIRSGYHRFILKKKKNDNDECEDAIKDAWQNGNKGGLKD